MSQPHNLEDTLRAHDKAIVAWLGTLHVSYGDAGGLFASAKDDVSILRRLAAPSRAGAAMLDFLIRSGWVTGAQAETLRAGFKESGLSVLPLPFATIRRGDPYLDPELVNVPYRYRRLEILSDGKTRVHPYPGYYRTDYTVTFWSHRRYTDNYIREWVMSELGNRGVAANELLIPVEHVAPWGTLDQSLKMTGSTDASNLEGADPLYMRVEYTFALRTLLFRSAVEDVDIIESGQAVPEPALAAFGWQSESGQPDETSPAMSANLIYYPSADEIANLWPTTGTATAEVQALAPPTHLQFKSQQEGLKLSLPAASDIVSIVEASALKTDGIAVYGVWFDYLADAAVKLNIKQRHYSTGSGDPEVIGTNWTRDLPVAADWQRVTQFVVVDEDTLIVDMEYDSAAAVVHLSNPQVRRVQVATPLWCFNTVDAGGVVSKVWDGLESGPYLCIAMLTSGSGTMYLDDDEAAPVAIRSEVYDATTDLAVVMLQQPTGSTLKLRFPSTTTLASVRLVRYHGPYHGNTV